MFDTINIENLTKFVDAFYEKARKDEEIGPIFNGRIGNSKKGWERHKAVVSSFWLFHLRGEHNYDAPPKHKGGMVRAHQDMSPFPKEKFSVWLRLFEETLDELFDEKCKNEILKKAKDLAGGLQGVLYEGKEWPAHLYPPGFKGHYHDEQDENAEHSGHPHTSKGHPSGCPMHQREAE